MALLLRTRAQDDAGRKRSIIVLFLAIVSAHLGALEEAHFFLVAAGFGLQVAMSPSRRW